MIKFDSEGETGLYFPFFFSVSYFWVSKLSCPLCSLYFNFRGYVLTLHSKPRPGPTLSVIGKGRIVLSLQFIVIKNLLAQRDNPLSKS